MTESDVTDRYRVWIAPTMMIGAVVVLIAFGLVMLTSASRVRAADRYGDPLFLLSRQIIWLGVSVVATLIVAHLDYRWYKKWAWCLLVIAVIGLIMVFVPGIGVRRGGSNRWIAVAGFQFQPSEFAKLAIIIALAAWYADRSRATTLLRGAVLPFMLIGTIAGLLFLEPDYGTVALVSAIGIGIMFVSGVKLVYLVVPSLAGIGVFSLAILHDLNRWRRVASLWNPELYPAAAYQLQQSKTAFSLGEWSGIGLGESIQKHHYLPEAHNDFIFAIIGEELGLLATGAIVLLFLIVFLCGLQIAARAPDRFGRLLGTGLAMILSVQAVINIAVVTGCLPTKGITLPFISYGGSSLLMSMIFIGIIVSIARHADLDDDDNDDSQRRPPDFIRNRELKFSDV